MTESVQSLAKRYLRQRQCYEKACALADREEKEMERLADELAPRIAPSDIKEGDSIGIWVRWGDEKSQESLITVTRFPYGEWELEVRR